MSFIVERTDVSPREFLSLKLGRDFGQPAGAFTKRREEATVFAPADEAARAIECLGPSHVLCAVRDVTATGPLPLELGGFPSGFVSDFSNKL